MLPNYTVNYTQPFLEFVKMLKYFTYYHLITLF